MIPLNCDCVADSTFELLSLPLPLKCWNRHAPLTIPGSTEHRIHAAPPGTRRGTAGKGICEPFYDTGIDRTRAQVLVPALLLCTISPSSLCSHDIQSCLPQLQKVQNSLVTWQITQLNLYVCCVTRDGCLKVTNMIGVQ